MTTTSLPRRLLRVLRDRLLQLLPVLIGLSVVTFLLVRLLPGGPAQTLVGVRASPQAIDAVNRQLGLGDPLPVQYGRYLSNLLRGSLGDSLISGISVNSILDAHLGNTLFLVVYAVTLAVTIGVPLAVLSAYRRHTTVDSAIRLFTVIGFGLPSFWVGVLLLSFFGLRLGWFPSGGVGPTFISNLSHFFLPALTLGLTFIAVLVRSLRSAIADIVRADHVDAARLKGLPARLVLTRHVLRIALLPAITLVGLNMSYLLGTSVIVENVFAIDGVGQQLVSAVLQRDFLVVQGIALVFGLLVLAISLIVDLLQAALDPRTTS